MKMNLQKIWLFGMGSLSTIMVMVALMIMIKSCTQPKLNPILNNGDISKDSDSYIYKK